MTDRSAGGVIKKLYFQFLCWLSLRLFLCLFLVVGETMNIRVAICHNVKQSFHIFKQQSTLRPQYRGISSLESWQFYPLPLSEVEQYLPSHDPAWQGTWVGYWSNQGVQVVLGTFKYNSKYFIKTISFFFEMFKTESVLLGESKFRFCLALWRTSAF